MINQITHFLFYGLVILLIVFLLLCVKKINFKLKLSTMIIMAWLGVVGILSVNGVFMNFKSLPPRILIVVLPMAALLLYVAKSSKIVPIVKNIPHSYLMLI